MLASILGTLGSAFTTVGGLLQFSLLHQFFKLSSMLLTLEVRLELALVMHQDLAHVTAVREHLADLLLLSTACIHPARIRLRIRSSLVLPLIGGGRLLTSGGRLLERLEHAFHLGSGEVLEQQVLSIARMHIERLAKAHVSFAAQVSNQVVPAGHRNVAHTAEELAQVLVETHEVHPTKALHVPRTLNVAVKLLGLVNLDVAEAAAICHLLTLVGHCMLCHWAQLFSITQQPLNE